MRRTVASQPLSFEHTAPQDGGPLFVGHLLAPASRVAATAFGGKGPSVLADFDFGLDGGFPPGPPASPGGTQYGTTPAVGPGAKRKARGRKARATSASSSSKKKKKKDKKKTGTARFAWEATANALFFAVRNDLVERAFERISARFVDAGYDRTKSHIRGYYFRLVARIDRCLAHHDWQLPRLVCTSRCLYLRVRRVADNAC